MNKINTLNPFSLTKQSFVLFRRYNNPTVFYFYLFTLWHIDRSTFLSIEICFFDISMRHFSFRLKWNTSDIYHQVQKKKLRLICSITLRLSFLSLIKLFTENWGSTKFIFFSLIRRINIYNESNEIFILD
jgi:hypothetical protein